MKKLASDDVAIGTFLIAKNDIIGEHQLKLSKKIWMIIVYNAIRFEEIDPSEPNIGLVWNVIEPL